MTVTRETRFVKPEPCPNRGVGQASRLPWFEIAGGTPAPHGDAIQAGDPGSACASPAVGPEESSRGDAGISYFTSLMASMVML